MNDPERSKERGKTKNKKRKTMKNVKTRLFRFSAVGCAALAIFLAGCASPSGSSRTDHQAKSDRKTGDDVKKALADAPVFKYPDVGVSAYGGTIQLTGFVQTPEQRGSAAEVASRVLGVDHVINGITVVPMAPGGATIEDAPGQIKAEPNQEKLQPTGK
jgi:osmotically-inducible protein OsmY